MTCNNIPGCLICSTGNYCLVCDKAAHYQLFTLNSLSYCTCIDGYYDYIQKICVSQTLTSCSSTEFYNFAKLGGAGCSTCSISCHSCYGTGFFCLIC